jgi:hypothetical protein
MSTREAGYTRESPASLFRRSEKRFSKLPMTWEELGFFGRETQQMEVGRTDVRVVHAVVRLLRLVDSEYKS